MARRDSGDMSVGPSATGSDTPFLPSLAPSLSFVGVPSKILVPWYFETQARWVAQVLSGRRALSPEEEMLRSVEEHYRAREAAGVPRKHTHNIGGVEPLVRTYIAYTFIARPV